jgi:hypothetical protein
MKSAWGAVARLAAIIKASTLASLDKSTRRSAAKANAQIEQLVKPALPFIPLNGWGRESKGPHPRHWAWPLNHYSTKWHPSARNGAQECARRMRQIARGQLRSENGLAV